MKHWEYKIIEIDFSENKSENKIEELEKKLNILGVKGWEVVTAPLHSLKGVVNSVSTVFVLKREIEASGPFLGL